MNKIKMRFQSSGHIAVCFLLAFVGINCVDAQEPFTIDELIVLKGHGDAVNTVAFNPSGMVLCSGGDDAQVIWWDLASIVQASRSRRQNISLADAPSATWEMDRRKIGERVVSLDFNGRGDVLAASGVTHWGNGFGSNVLVFTTARKDPFGLGGAKVSGSYTSVALDASATLAAMGAKNDELKVVRLRTKRGKNGRLEADFVSKTAPAIPGAVLCVDFHPHKPLIAAAGRGGWIRFYSVGVDGLARVTPARTPSHDANARVTGLRFTSDGRPLVTVADDKNLMLVDATTGTNIRTWAPVDSVAIGLDIHPNDQWMVAAYEDGVPRILDIETGAVVADLPKHDGAVRAVAFSSDGNFVASGGSDHLIRIVELKTEDRRRAKRR